MLSLLPATVAPQPAVSSPAPGAQAATAAGRPAATPGDDKPAGPFAKALDEAAQADHRAPPTDRGPGKASAHPAQDTARLRRAAAAPAGHAATAPGDAAAAKLALLNDTATVEDSQDTAASTAAADTPGADGALPPEALSALLAQLRTAQAAVPGGPRGAVHTGPAGAAAGTAGANTVDGLDGAARSEGADSALVGAGALRPGHASGQSAGHGAGHPAGRASGGEALRGAGADPTLAAAGAAGASTPADAALAQPAQGDFARQLADAVAGPGARAPDVLTPMAAQAPAGVLGAPGSAPAEARLPAGPGSADFGPQFSAQVTTFVRDGIEHARLHLNPAEMGPVSVQIQLDGNTALVHLSAENPQTRQALEQCMPELAGSLREAGLTLTGGGVFEQPRQGNNGSADRAPAPRDRSAAADADEPQPAALERVAAPARRRGAVDLVA